jgi:hypothetical protein
MVEHKIICNVWYGMRWSLKGFEIDQIGSVGSLSEVNRTASHAEISKEAGCTQYCTILQIEIAPPPSPDSNSSY